MWKTLAPQPELYRHQPEDPHWMGPVLRAQELVAQNCGRDLHKESNASFHPERKL